MLLTADERWGQLGILAVGMEDVPTVFVAQESRGGTMSIGGSAQYFGLS